MHHQAFLFPTWTLTFKTRFSLSLRAAVSLDQARVYIFREDLESLWSAFLKTLQVVRGAVWLFGSAIWGETRRGKFYLLQVGLLTLFLISAYVSTRKWRNLSGSWDWALVPGGPVKSCSHWLEQYCSYIIWACAAENRLEVDLRHYFFLVWDQECEFMIPDYRWCLDLSHISGPACQLLPVFSSIQIYDVLSSPIPLSWRTHLSTDGHLPHKCTSS